MFKSNTSPGFTVIELPEKQPVNPGSPPKTFTYCPEIHHEVKGVGCEVGAHEGPKESTGCKTPLSIGRKFILLEAGSKPGHKKIAANDEVGVAGNAGTMTVVCNPTYSLGGA